MIHFALQKLTHSYGLLGASGCGKTTLLNCIIGRMKLISGELWVLGGSPGTKSSVLPSPKIGYMPQEIGLYGDFTIKETAKYFGWIAAMTTEEIEERFQFLKDLLKLPEDHRIIKSLSGGQQRRVSFATSLLHRPELLILDEPTVGLDPVLRETIWDYLTDVTKNGYTTVIITTHYIEETRKAHVISLMRKGYIIAEESPNKLLSRFGINSLEEAFLKLSIIQNSQITHRRRNTISAPVITEANIIPLETLNEVEEESDDNASEFGECVARNRFQKRFSLIPDLYPSELLDTNTYQSKITDYLPQIDMLHMKALVWKNCLWIWKNWIIITAVVVGPLVAFVLFYLAIGHKPVNLQVAFVNQESNDNSCDILMCNSTTLGCQYLQYVKGDRINMIPFESEEMAILSVKKGLLHGSITIRYNYSSALRARIEDFKHVNAWDVVYSTIDVYRDSSVKDIAQFLDFYILDAFARFVKDYLISCNESGLLIKLPFKWNDPVYGSNDTEFTRFAAPGILASCAFFYPAALTAIALLVERREGIFERSVVMGVTPFELLISHIISESGLMLIQIGSLMALAIFFFDMTLSASTVLATGLVALIGFCGMWFGYTISSTCDDESTAIYILLGTFLPMFFLSGILWPIEGFVYELRAASAILPLTQPSESLRSIIQRGWGLSKQSVYNGCITISVWILFFIVLSIVALKFKRA
ncbi:ABC transporter G family member 20-like isoform X2 [Photinus pyralis]|uniref:ABC transporter G family member 20-like isoform X2 n=1 Tax=Photinus pyralis TaxID=7054 RepID=UPI0012672B0B|nr:ABC transporter G family member 20-like isoform X2 [Photinus pyralis]